MTLSPECLKGIIIASGLIVVLEERSQWPLPTKMNLEAFQDLGLGLGGGESS